MIDVLRDTEEWFCRASDRWNNGHVLDPDAHTTGWLGICLYCRCPVRYSRTLGYADLYVLAVYIIEEEPF